MKTDYFGLHRIVLLFEFKDYISKFRCWWLVVDKGEVDVCMKDPGHEIDLQVSTDLKTLTGIWLGEISYNKAIRGNRLTMTGPVQLKRDISKWLGTNYFSDIKPAHNVN